MGFAMMMLALTSAQAADGAPPVMVNMVPPAAIEGGPLRQPEGEGFRCSAGYADCVRIIVDEGGSAQLGVFDMDAAAEDIPPIALPLQVATEERQALTVWDRAIRLPSDPAVTQDGRIYLIGIVRETLVGFSGGGASGRRLHLFRLVIAGASAELGPEIVSLPWASEAMIRACFTDQDSRNRRGECHDQYRFVPSLTLAADRNGPYPDMTYSAVATAFPRTSRRSEDNSGNPPLTAADLTEWRDPDCSYARTLRYNPATERYEMDRPGPDCASYTRP